VARSGAVSCASRAAAAALAPPVKSIPPFLRYEIEGDGIVLVEIVGVVATLDDVAQLDRNFGTLYDGCRPPIDVVIGMSGFVLRAEVAREVSTMRTRLLTTRVRHTARYAVPRVLATLIHTTAALTRLDAFLFAHRDEALASIRARRSGGPG
jgi:hypothetical protein